MLEKIHTYIINLEKRVDRKNHILNEFANRLEFEVFLIKAVTDSDPAVGLYKSLLKVVSEANQKKLPYILFCEDDHQFTESFDKINLKEQILIVENLSADILLGGVVWFDYGTKTTSDTMWINHFTGTQFLIIYSKFYDIILNAKFNSGDAIDEWLARLSNKKYLINPMISIQKFFGYSDVTVNNSLDGLVDKLIESTINRLIALDQVFDHVTKIRGNESENLINCDDLQMPLYLIRTNTNNNISEQFRNRSEFLVEEIKSNSLFIDEVDLMELIKVSIRLAVSRNEDIIIICKDTHLFSHEYNKDILFKNIIKASLLGGDLISGGNRSIRQVVVADENLCWVDSMESFEFLIIYEKFYYQILNINLLPSESICAKLSFLSANKFLFYPFITKFYYDTTENEYCDERKYYKIKNQKYNINSRVMDVIYTNSLI